MNSVLAYFFKIKSQGSKISLCWKKNTTYTYWACSEVRFQNNYKFWAFFSFPHFFKIGNKNNLTSMWKNRIQYSSQQKKYDVGWVLSSFFWKKKIKFCSQITFLKLFSKWKIEFVKWLIQFLRKITPNPKTNKKWLIVFWWFATLQPSVSQWIWQTRKFWPVFSSTPVEIKNK